MSRKRQGFTKVEVLILFVSAMIGTGLALGAVLKVQDDARRKETNYRLKDLGVAVHACNDLHRCLPAAIGPFGDIKVNRTLHVHLLPFLTKDTLYEEIRKEEGDLPASLLATAVNSFLAPMDRSYRSGGGVENFAANVRIFTDVGFYSGTGFSNTHGISIVPVPMTGLAPFSPAIPRTFVDGTSNVIVFASRVAFNNPGSAAPDCSSWYGQPFESAGAFFGQAVATAPASAKGSDGITFQIAPWRGAAYCSNSAIPHSFGPGGLSVCLGDASVRNINPSIDTKVWMKALQPNDGGPLATNLCQGDSGGLPRITE